MGLASRTGKIFVEFQLAARSSVVEVSKRLRLKPHIVRSELMRLLDRNIAHPYVLMNPSAMGLLDVEVLCSFGSEMQRSLHQLVRSLQKLPGIFTVNVTGGEFQVGFGLQVRNLNELSLALDSLCTSTGLVFERRSVAMCTGWELFARKYMSSRSPQQKSFRMRSDVEVVAIDDTDRAILLALKDAPLASFREIAQTVRAAESTVIYRVNSLCEAGVIVGFGLSIDGTDIGMHTFRIVIRAANPTLALRDAIYKFAARHPYVLSCSSYVGDWDYFLMTEVYTPLDVFAVTRELASAVAPHRIEVAVIPVLREIHFRTPEH